MPGEVLGCLQGVIMFLFQSLVFVSLGHVKNWRLRNEKSLPKFTQLVNDKVGI